jgi:glycosyltransferase involved in cell wall biosynthesis
VISFVVPAYNEEKYLGPTLAAIHAAARAVGEPYEIVVANDGSTDNTAQLAETGGARVVTVQKRQIAGTRNAGAAAAQGEWLVFVDADTRVNADVVRGTVEAFRGGAVAGGAPVRFDGGPRWVHWTAPIVVFLFRHIKWAAGCFLFARRDVFEKVGGFDERFYASEEIHLSRALKRHGRFVMVDAAVTTSARKAETHSPWAMIKLMARILARGEKGLKSRELTASFWYPDKR